MFLARCDELGRDVIIWTSSVEGIQNTADGIVVFYRCACGRSAEMLTGSGSPVRVNVHVDSAA